MGGSNQPASKAVLDAQAAKAAADKAYVDAQNFASTERGRLGSAQAQFEQADRLEVAASDKYAKNQTPQNYQAVLDAHDVSKSFSHEVAEQNSINNTAIANVNATTAARDKANADLQAATATTTSGAGSSGSGKSSGGGILSTNHFPSGQVIASGSSSMGNSGSTITPIPTTTAPILQTAATTTATSTGAANAVATGADLVLEDIQLASPATAVAGPAYTVKFRNQGTGLATKFQVGVMVGIDGGLAADAPRGVVEVKSLAAGATSEVTLRLPQTALKLSRKDGRPTAFTHLFVAIDLLNSVAETDESNNTAVVERATLETLTAN